MGFVMSTLVGENLRLDKIKEYHWIQTDLHVLEHTSTANLQGMAFQDHFVEGSMFFFFQPVADLPTQPPVGLWNPKTPLPID